MLNRSRRNFVRNTSLAGIAAVLARPGSLLAQADMLESARVVTGFPPGGTSDTCARRVADGLRGRWARTTVVENRTGAGGQIAVQAMKAAPTDGSVILQTPASMLMIYPHTYKQLQYDPFRDVAPASLACTFEFGFAVGPAVPASVTSVPEFIAWCKADAARANYASPGAGSLPHFIGVLLGKSSKTELRHIAYRGTQPAIVDLVGGQVSAVSGPTGEFTQQAAAGRIRIIATSGPKRSRFAPSVPTFVEQGYKELEFTEWFGLYVPGRTPDPVVQRLNAALRAVLADKSVIDGLAVMGLEAAWSSSADLAALLKRDHDRWAPLVKEIGFTAEA